MNEESLNFAVVAARAAEDKLAQEISVRDVGDLFAISEAFIIATGRSDRHVRSIVDGVTEALREQCGKKPIRVEGLQEAEWVLLDFGEVVVHVFDVPTRSFYDLDRLWADAPQVDWVVPVSM